MMPTLQAQVGALIAPGAIGLIATRPTPTTATDVRRPAPQKGARDQARSVSVEEKNIA